jgi:multisubunit Na+/H+ antiporter MnhF subunit
MNLWLLAAAILGAALIPCAGVALVCEAADGLVAVQVGSIVLSAILLLLAEGLHRQPFVDLAVVFSIMSTIASLTFARLMEKDL